MTSNRLSDIFCDKEQPHKASPDYNKAPPVKTNVGKTFLWPREKHSPCHCKYRKQLNNHNVKISYSYMLNMKSVIRDLM